MTKGKTFKLRPMAARDIPAVVHVDRIVFKDPWPEAAYVQELYFNPNAHYFVLMLQDPSKAQVHYDYRTAKRARLLGFVGMRVEGDRGHISTLALRKEWRGLHLGELLLLKAISQAIEDEAWSIGLEVRVSNHVAQKLYEKYRFKPSSRLTEYYADGEDAFYLRAMLSGDQFFGQIRVRLADLADELDVEIVDS
jgi:ribosomal-protein-alanine N-acetyltransferase